MKGADAERICRVEGDAPMGSVFRHYWLPILHSDRLTPGGAPIKVRILGEDYVAFRSPNGKAGLIGERCPHRGVSMLLARNEDCGLRCIQHGWAIDTAGTVIEAPNMPSGAALHQIPTNARAVEERHGMVWAWFGDRDHVPPLTPYDFLGLPVGHVSSVMATGRCNWLQLLETLWDPFHVSVLHKSALSKVSAAGSAKSTFITGLMKLEFEATDYGFFYRSTSDGKTTGTPFVMPCYCIHFLGADESEDCIILGHVPVDDAHMLMWGIVFNLHHPLKPDGKGLSFIDSFPRRFEYRDDRGVENMWLQDRARMESGESFSGLEPANSPYGVFVEDLGTIESMGGICDRVNEVLAPTDQIVVQGRHRLLQIVGSVARGAPPPGVTAEALRNAMPSFAYLEPAQ
ncbi:Rieske 2Fe-2S domain-containing protein [Novosphingobium sp. BL-52-GroH]|uniref:Rieske 2Fe-2S domain-containing protein n=1 Tax=Novosphingobium sp. BL-52-GroH TaxID=3349877 RepID=UPI00384C88AB